VSAARRNQRSSHAAAGLALVLSALLLAGCGFHLRGSPAATSAAPASVVILDTARQRGAGTWLGGGPGERARVISETLRAGGIAVIDGDAGTGSVQLELLDERIDKRVASVDATASAAEYQLDYTLAWRVRAPDGATLVKDTRLTLDRSYRHKTNAIMGSADEEALLQRDLRRDAALQILRRLRQLPPVNVSHAAGTEAPHAAQP
jgi:LPS-assembly lipoprotein